MPELQNRLNTWSLLELRTLTQAATETGVARSTLVLWAEKGYLVIETINAIKYTTIDQVHTAMAKAGRTPERTATP